MTTYSDTLHGWSGKDRTLGGAQKEKELGKRSALGTHLESNKILFLAGGLPH